MDERDEIKNKIDIVDLVGGYVQLKKAGRNYKACCPFHTEKTASFVVSPEKQMWHCFGSCGEGGDIFGFVMKMEGLDFYSALKMLADRAGVKLERTSTKDYNAEKDKKDKLFEINEIAYKYYERALLSKDGEVALKYLKKRGLTEKTIKEFRLGYAPKKSALLDELKKIGFVEAELLAAGIAKRRDGKLMDYFWQRIIFPISDSAGSVVAFTARTLDDEVQPKYLNTPETDIYHKSNVLYGMDRAKTAIRKLDHAIIVEGNMDVIASHQVGVKNVVAASGTAFTETQLNIIGRFTKNLKISFDVDTAGSEATKRAIEMAMREGFNVKIIEVPEGKDPADAINKDKNLWTTSCKNALYVIDYLFKKAFLKHDVRNILGKKAIARELLGVIKKIPDTIEQEHYIKELSGKLDVSDESLKNALSKVKTNVHPSVSSKKEEDIKENQGLLEERLFGLLLYMPEYQNFFLRNTRKEDIDKDFSEVYEVIAEKRDLKKIKNQKAALLQMKAESEFGDFTAEKLGEEIFFLTKRLRMRKLGERKRAIEEKIKEVERGSDNKELKSLIKELNEVIKEESKV